MTSPSRADAPVTPPPLLAAVLGAASLVPLDLLYGQVSGRWSLALLALSLTLVAPLARGRFSLTVAGERIALLLTAGASAALVWLAPAVEDGHTLARVWSLIGLTGLFVGAGRIVVRAARPASYSATLLPGLWALTACGETRAGTAYLGAVALHLALALAAARAHDPGRPPLPKLGPRHLAGGAVVLAVAVTLTVTGARTLPTLSASIAARIVQALGQPRTGFTDRLELGGLTGLLQSDEVVIRLEGPPTDYLRGVVYDRYESGFWRATPGPAPPIKPSDKALPATRDRVRASFVGGARDRYFLPLGARDVALEGGDGGLDRFGAFRSLRGAAEAASFRLPAEGESLSESPDAPVLDPTQEDITIPHPLARTLDELTEAWTRGAKTRKERVEAIAAHLRAEYTYSLDFETTRRRDPVLEFLADRKSGHCEYFASSLALLYRRAGIPARVVVGYRVAEHNALGGYWVVREKNAHAWVEVWLRGEGWRTIDATPDAHLPQNAPHELGFLSGVRDYAALLWAKLVARVLDASLGEIVMVLVGVIVLGLAVRWWQQRTGGSRGAGPVGWEAPPPAVSRLLEALAGRGARRAAAEPLERFADRLDDDPTLAGAAGLLRRYAAYRYGGVGDLTPLLAELEGCVTLLQKPPPEARQPPVSMAGV